ncbi:MAG: hypothetical protein RIS70_3087 [Planctomycetota bacterium]
MRIRGGAAGLEQQANTGKACEPGGDGPSPRRVTWQAWSRAGWQGWWQACTRATDALADLFFPPVCLACDAELQPQSVRLCSACQDGIGFASAANCPRCAAPLPQLGSQSANCLYCQRRKYRFRSTMAIGAYRGSLQQIVLRMKHSMHEPLATVMGQLLGDRVRSRCSDLPIDAVVPVPMHWWRRLRRGTPAAELLAEGVAGQTGWRLVRDLIVCRRATRKQGTLSPADRLENVADAFGVRSRYDVQNARVLLVDDVMTTGATLNAVAQALLRGGASEVHVAVLARGTGS